jgi:uroporphyrinogen decarboxylase
VIHRQRVQTALSHERTDRPPMQISFVPEFAQRLRAQMGGRQSRPHNPHGGGNTHELERMLDVDMLLTSVGWANSYYRQSSGEYTDEWGVTWKAHQYTTRFGNGVYTEIIGHPLAEAGAIDSYVSPDPTREELFRDAQRTIRDYKDEYWIVGVTVCTMLETGWAFRGLDTLLMDFLVNPDIAEVILDVTCNYHLAVARRLVEMGVDMIWMGDDVGTQRGMLLSPSIWRRFLKPRMARFIQVLHEVNPAIKVAYHSDGDIRQIIPDLIEIGVDVLNPIQPACMDPADLKRRYGDHLCFWGSIDEQHTLPFGSPQDVRNEVLDRCATIGRDGGLILGPTHHVQLDTPLENFWAMVEAIKHGVPGRTTRIQEVTRRRPALSAGGEVGVSPA